MILTSCLHQTKSNMKKLKAKLGLNLNKSNPEISNPSSSRKVFPEGIKELYSGPEATVDIVFVHGLTGDREETWGATNKTKSWPETFLPTANGFRRTRILTFGYDAYVANWTQVASTNRIGDHARNLLSRLANHRENDGTDSRPIVFVVHSLGGLVCENALWSSSSSPELHLRKIIECTVGIAFMGTPQAGSSLAPWASKLSQFIGVIKQTNSDILDPLNRDSAMLAVIKEGFFEMLRVRRSEGKPPIQITCFYEQLPLRVVGTVVEMGSAILPEYTKIGIRANHMDMTKFASVDEQGFIDLCSEIRRWIKSLNQPPPPSM